MRRVVHGLGRDFSVIGGLGWVELVSRWVGLDRVTQNGPVDDSERASVRARAEGFSDRLAVDFWFMFKHIMKRYQFNAEIGSISYCNSKGSPYSITKRRVLELIPVLGSQPAGDVSHKPGGRLPLLSARPAVLPPQPLRGLLPILLLGEQRHNGCEQFA